ncbi:hypothetical protein [Microbulbifer spongiae]|uniref:DUF4468 domain-containing protein n=1 Tax=Microbulbifer spongiae TaxID=2944933 RepID=A0ABY9E6V9_9GAMM|nr:hypothetical protein [Microbulbifer sp. MI-G]WKD48758.1 hypothetical protein M8T91_12660 [Microbulbifer sp. MI-G]
MKIIYIIKLICMGLLFCVPIHLKAYTVQKKSLSELFQGSFQVSKIEINSSEKSYIYRDGKVYNCGFRYTANAISNYKGKEKKIVFKSTSSLLAGSEYLIFFNVKYLDAQVNYLSMGKDDINGYEACTEEKLLYASTLHDEIFEFDSLWKIITGSLAVKAFSNAPFLESLKAKRVAFESNEAPKEYLEAISYWRISWEIFEEKLISLASINKD